MPLTVDNNVKGGSRETAGPAKLAKLSQLVHDAWKRSKDRIAHELASAQRILEAPQAVYANIAEPLRIAFDVLQRSSELYRNGSPKIRRLMNQFFFKKLLIADESVAGAVLDEPWWTLLA